MDIPLDEQIYFDAITTHPTTGAATDADSTPTFAVYEEATDTDIGVGGNMTKRTSLTGNYRGTFTASAANGFEVGKWYSIIGSATVNSIAGKAVLKNFRIVAAEAVVGTPKVDATHVSGTVQTAGDLAALLATLSTYVDTEVAAIKAKTDNLPSDPADASDVATLIAAVQSAVNTIAGYVDTEVAAIKAKTDLIPASPAAVGSAMTLTSGERDSISAALLDLTDGVEGGLTLRQHCRIAQAALAGIASGLATASAKYRDKANTKDRITATVDADGNRSAVTLDAT